MAYSLRERKAVTYKDTTFLPRATKVKKSKLYPIEVLEETEDRVKIHFTGYDAKYDEWRDRSDIVAPKCSLTQYRPFSLYNELKYQIKLALDSKRRKEPEVRIEIPFDEVLFNGGLKLRGVFQQHSHGHEVYTISNFSSLTPFIGEGWWYRCLNKHMNFCYINKNTVRYYLHNRVPVAEYNPEQQKMEKIAGGPVLVFRFVRMDGVAREWAKVTAQP